MQNAVRIALAMIAEVEEEHPLAALHLSNGNRPSEIFLYKNKRETRRRAEKRGGAPRNAAVESVLSLFFRRTSIVSPKEKQTYIVLSMSAIFHMHRKELGRNFQLRSRVQQLTQRRCFSCRGFFRRRLGDAENGGHVGCTRIAPGSFQSIRPGDTPEI